MSARHVASDAQSAATALIAVGSLVEDPHGRRWLMMNALCGYTRSVTDGCWWYGERFNPRKQELVPVASRYIVAALDAWESNLVDAVDAELVA